MNAPLADVLAALAAQLRDQVSGDVVVFDYLPGVPPVPSLAVVPGETDYGQAMAGALEADQTLNVQALVDMSEPGQRRMYRFLDTTGTDSVAAAIVHDRTLGGLVGNLVVDTASPPALANIAGAAYLLAVWSVRVF